MADVDRPDWCPDPNCLCLTGFDGRMCWGRLPHKRPHDPGGRDPDGEEELYNTHMFCTEAQNLAINDEDACLFGEGFGVVRKDVADNKLYRPPGWKDTWDFRGK